MSQFSASTWATAEENSSDERKDPPPPGMYEVVLEQASAFTSKKQEDWVLLKWKIVKGGEPGYTWDDIRGFRSAAAVAALKGTLSRMGVKTDVPNLDELDGQLKTVVGEWYAIDVVENGKYRNIYIKDRVQPGTAPAAAEVPATHTADDIPW